MKGDRVEIVVDAGNSMLTYDITATRAGRRVEISNRRGVIEVSEVTRTGTVVRTARFMTSRVLALVEHPADASAGMSGQSRTLSEAGLTDASEPETSPRKGDRMSGKKRPYRPIAKRRGKQARLTPAADQPSDGAQVPKARPSGSSAGQPTGRTWSTPSSVTRVSKAG